MAKAPTIDAEDVADESDVLAQLKSLGLALAQGADDVATQDKTLGEILDKVGTLSKRQRTALFQQPGMRELVEAALEADRPAPADDPPGTVYTHPQFGKFRKKVWTEGDLRKKVEAGEMRMVTFRARENHWIGFQGLVRRGRAGQTYTWPSCFTDQIDYAEQAAITAEQHAAWLFQEPDRQGHYHVPLPDDPTIVTPESVMVRGAGSGRANIGGGYSANPTSEGDAA